MTLTNRGACGEQHDHEGQGDTITRQTREHTIDHAARAIGGYVSDGTTGNVTGGDMTTGEANQEQRAYWNDQAGPRWVKLQQRLDAQIQPLGLATMQRAEITPGECVLDVGCGCGQTSLELAGRVGPQGLVRAIDLSLPMLERASERQ
jgi:2-polyprenyl-3-methyl-5-hydroxy-6-metoxy-1,4-benzoquinol methylase